MNQSLTTGCILIPILLNWYVITETNFLRTGGRNLHDEFGPIASALGLSLLIVLWQAWNLLRQRAGLRLGLAVRKICCSRKALWFVCAVPLLFKFHLGWSWIEPDGTTSTRTLYYGHSQLSLLLFALVVTCLVLVQVRTTATADGSHATNFAR